MSVWILHLTLTPEEENALTLRASLPLPIEGVMDLSNANSLAACRKLLPGDLPPETLARQAERIWRIRSALAIEDIVAVRLHSKRELALAEVTGHYHYDAAAKEPHTVPVKWYGKRVPYRALAGHKELLEKPGLFEVENKEVRTAIRGRLPYGYNRFVWLKWLLVALVVMRLTVRFLHHAHYQ